MLGVGAVNEEDGAAAEQAFRQRVYESTVGDYPLSRELRLTYGGASVGVVSVTPGTLDAVQALRVADEAMYAVKRERQSVAGARTRLAPADVAPQPARRQA